MMDFKKMNGLLPVIIQDSRTLNVLMLGYMNKEALDVTLESGYVTFYSRSKGRLWKKGESSGNCLKVGEIFQDCDNDALLIRAAPEGPTCHLGEKSCFKSEGSFVEELFGLIEERKKLLPHNSYTTSLFEDGEEKILAKVAEESAEVIVAAKSEGRQRLIEELADLQYHLMVLMAEKNLTLGDVEEELKKRNQ